MLRFQLVLVCLCMSFTGRAQVEIFRGETDTSTYIAPGDTITKAPDFNGSLFEFYRYIENHYNVRLYGQYLNPIPDNVRFSFYVEKNGKLSDFKMIYTNNRMLANEIQNIITMMPEWNPGKQVGKKKRTLMVFDLNVQLTDDLPGVLITENKLVTEFSNKHKGFKWFVVAGTVIVMITLYLTR